MSNNNIVIKLPSSFLGEFDGAQTIPEKIAVIQSYLKKLEDAKKERAEWRKQLQERANLLQEQRDALRDQRKQIEEEKKQIYDLKKAIAERRKANMTDDQKKALDEEEKAVEEREKTILEREKETEDSEKVVDDQLKEVEIENKQAEELDSAQDAETILLSTTLQNFVNSSAPATTSATGPSTSLALTPPAPPESSLPASRPQTVASSFSPLRPTQQTSGIVLTSPATTGPSTSLTLSPPAPPESSLPAATFSRSQTVASSSFSPLRPPSGIVPTPPESSLPAATFPRPPTGASSFSPLRPTSGNLLTAPTFATLPFFPSRNISTQPVFVGPPDVTLGPRNAARFTWTPQQKQSFDEAIQRLGGLYGKSVTATAKDVKELMEDDDVTESQIANRIQNMRRKHPRDDGGESSSGKKQC